MMRLSSLSGSRRQLPPPAIASTSQAANVHRGGDHGGSGEAVERHEITDSECCARMFIDGGRNRRSGFGWGVCMPAFARHLRTGVRAAAARRRAVLSVEERAPHLEHSVCTLSVPNHGLVGRRLWRFASELVKKNTVVVESESAQRVTPTVVLY